jgi:hypothetical protein
VRVPRPRLNIRCPADLVIRSMRFSSPRLLVILKDGWRPSNKEGQQVPVCCRSQT